MQEGQRRAASHAACVASVPVEIVTMARYGDGPSYPGRAAAVNVGSRRQPAVDLDHRALAPPARRPWPQRRRTLWGDPRPPPGGAQRPLRIGIADDRPGPDDLAALQHDRRPPLGEDGGDGDAGQDDGAGLGGGVGEGQGDPAHSAFDVAPGARLPFQGAEGVHGVDGGGARVPGAGEGADDPLAVEGGAEPLVCARGARSQRRSACRTGSRSAPGRARGAPRVRPGSARARASVSVASV